MWPVHVAHRFSHFFLIYSPVQDKGVWPVRVARDLKHRSTNQIEALVSKYKCFSHFSLVYSPVQDKGVWPVRVACCFSHFSLIYSPCAGQRGVASARGMLLFTLFSRILPCAGQGGVTSTRGTLLFPLFSRILPCAGQRGVASARGTLLFTLFSRLLLCRTRGCGQCAWHSMASACWRWLLSHGTRELQRWQPIGRNSGRGKGEVGEYFGGGG